MNKWFLNGLITKQGHINLSAKGAFAQGGEF